MNHVVLVKTKCHNPNTGTYSKVIMMFDVHIYSRMSLERKKNCLSHICELPRDYRYETYIVRGRIPSEVSTDRDEHVGHSLEILGSPSRKGGQWVGARLHKGRSPAPLQSEWMPRRPYKEFWKWVALGTLSSHMTQRIFLNMMLTDLTKCLPGFHLHWASSLKMSPAPVQSLCSKKKKSAVLTNHKMYIAPTLTHVVKPFSVILFLLPFHNFHFPVGP